MIGPARKKPLVHTSPIASHNFKQESSPSKGSTLIKTESSEYVSSLKAKKQNYSTALGLYGACYDNQLPQKCLKHLNFITLYCSDEQKLLCVNCLYGSSAHKNHSVTPSNSSIQDIRRDNQTHIREIDDEIKQIRDAETKANENKKIIQSQYSFIMQEMTRQFNQMRRMIDLKQKQLKQRTTRQFEKASIQNQITRKQIQWWRQQTLKVRNGLPRDSNSQQAQIYKHLVLQLMLNEKLQADKLTYVPSKEQMQYDFLNQTKQLKQTVKAKIQQGSRGNKLKLF